jgi:5-methylcytosine-specific restriction protein A
MAWATSTRAARLPRDWGAIRVQVRARAKGRCQGQDVLGVGIIGHAPTCDGIGSDADHITAGDNHSLDNLQWLSAACHRAKTARETARRNVERAGQRRRTERHPGALDS